MDDHADGKMSNNTIRLLLLTTLLTFVSKGWGLVDHANTVDDTVNNNDAPESSAKLAPLLSDTVSTATEQVLSVSATTQSTPVELKTEEHQKESELVSSQVPQDELCTKETELINNNDRTPPSSICIKQEVPSDNAQLDATPVITDIAASIATEEFSSERGEEAIGAEDTKKSVFDGDLSIKPTLSTAYTESIPSQAPSSDEQVQDQQQGDNSEQEDVLVKDALQEVKEFIKETSEKKEAKQIPEEQAEIPQTEESEHKVTLPTIELEAVEHNVELPVIEMGGREVQTPEEKTEVSSEGGEKTQESSQLGEATDDEQEDFPSFGEWTAKVLAQEEKTKQDLENLGNMPGGALQPKTVKQSRNNYASRECGAKILATNPEAKNTKSILNGNKDDYMTNPCTAKKWFTVELCEPIQVRTFELASFELFSSQPRMFKVLLSDRYPAKDWRLAGTFTATEERATQSFQVEDEHFSKFVKVEMVDHFREEHFCPLTLFRVFGVDLNYMNDDDDSAADAPTSQDPDSGDIITQEEEGEITTNLFESAKDTVISLVKKVLKVEGSEETAEATDTHNDTANTTNSEALVGENVTNGGIHLPCLPDIQIPVGNVTSENKRQDVNDSAILPEAPYPEISKSGDKMVIKLEDHEQPPSQDKLNEPLVTLIDWKYMDNIGQQHFAASCSTCHRGRKSFSEGRQLCRYFDLLLVNHYSKQSCPKRKPKQKPSEYFPAEESKDTEATSEDKETRVCEVDQSSVSGQQSETATDTQTSSAQDHTISSSAPNSPVSETSDVVSQSMQSSIVESEKDQTSIISNSPNLISPSLSSSVIDEPIISAQYSSTISSLEQSRASVVVSDETTYYPQAGEVVIPTPTQTELTEGLGESSSTDFVTEQKEPAPTSEQKIQESVELEPSYKSPTVIVSEGMLNEEDFPSATTTPELPPLTEDSVVNVDQQAGKNEKESDLKLDRQVNENNINRDLTQPPQEVSTEPVSVYATVVDESLTGSKEDAHVQGTNTMTENAPGNKPKKDLNLVRIPVSPLMKRESAMMRLNNRLKALEVNVSLSSRFLEELSKRYRKQSDEVMKLLNKTISRLNQTTKIVEQKDEENSDMIGILEARIDNLTSVVSQLVEHVGSLDQRLSERNLTWVILEAVIVALLMIMSWRRNKNPYITPELQKLLKKMPSGPPTGPPTPQRRRNSSTGTVGHSSPQPTLVKHSSESALDAQADLHIVEPLSSFSSYIKPEGNKKKKKKKQKSLDFNQGHYSKESPPIFTSSANQQFSSASVGGVTEPRMIDSCPALKPRSNSHSTVTFHSDSWINGASKKVGCDNSTASSRSSTSLCSVETLKEPYIVDIKPPLKHTQSAKRLPPPHTFPPPPTKISKSLSQKSLASSNYNRNAAVKKQMSEPWHHRAQSDGNVQLNPTSSTVPTATACRPASNKQKNRDGNIARSLDPGLTQQHKRSVLTMTPENLTATNGNTPTTTSSTMADLIGPHSQPTNQSSAGRKWSLGLKFISIKK